MEELVAELSTATWLAWQTIVLRLIAATVFGAVVGFEREWRERPAGLRTHILVCVSAATAAILAVEIVHMPAFEVENVRLDPTRLIEAVTAGVAFLAAGTIIFARGEIHGLTTGAGMWLAGAIGLSIGLGFWLVAGIATVLALLVLSALRTLEERFSLKGDEEAQRPAADDRQSKRGRRS